MDRLVVLISISQRPIYHPMADQAHEVPRLRYISIMGVVGLKSRGCLGLKEGGKRGGKILNARGNKIATT